MAGVAKAGARVGVATAAEKVVGMVVGAMEVEMEAV